MKASFLGSLAPGPDCARFAARLPLLNAGELADADAAEVRVHAAACPWCQQRLREYAALDAAVRRHIAALSAGFPAVSPEALIDRVDRHDLLSTPAAPEAPVLQRPRPLRRFVGWMAPLAAVLAVVILTVAIFVSRGAPSTGILPGGKPSGSTPTATPSTAGPASGVLYAVNTDSAGISRIWALRLSDGRLLWQSRQSGTFSDLVNDQGIVYAVLGDTESVSILALRASDGSFLWQSAPLKTEFEPALAAANGVVYFENSVYHQGDQGVPPITVAPALTAFRGSDGHLLWRYDAPDQMVSPPAILGNTLYLGVGTGVVALRLSDGARRWRASLGLKSLPALEWLSGDGNGLYAFVNERSANDALVASLHALRADTGTSLWQVELARGAPDAVAAPVVANGVVYVGTGSYPTSFVKGGPPAYNVVLYALRAGDGAQLWRYESPAFSPLYTSPLLGGPVFANGILYFVSGDGVLNALRANDQKLLWQRPLAMPAFPAPILAVTDQAIFVQTAASILALRTSDGGTIWQQQAGTPGA